MLEENDMKQKKRLEKEVVEKLQPNTYSITDL